MTINITPTGVLENAIMFGLVHGIWWVIKLVSDKGKKELRKELRKFKRELRKRRNEIIDNHVKADHEGRLKDCVDEACISLRKPGLPQSVPLVAEPVAHTD